MRHIFNCRRTFVALMAICCLTALGLHVGADVSGAIATTALAVAASNAAQKSFESMKGK